MGCRYFKANIFASSEYGNKQADLVFINRDYTDWVVVEVELSHHSLNSHVFPQAYTFKNGKKKVGKFKKNKFLGNSEDG